MGAGAIALINALLGSGIIQSVITLIKHPDGTLSVVQILDQNDAGFKADLQQGLTWEAELKAKMAPKV
jgi:hypothetical protein